MSSIICLLVKLLIFKVEGTCCMALHNLRVASPGLRVVKGFRISGYNRKFVDKVHSTLFYTEVCMLQN